MATHSPDDRSTDKCTLMYAPVIVCTVYTVEFVYREGRVALFSSAASHSSNASFVREGVFPAQKKSLVTIRRAGC